MCVCQCAHSACVSRAACVRFARVIVLAGSAHTSSMRASASALQTSAHDGRRCVAAWSEACRHWLFDAKTMPRTSSVRLRPSPSSSISGDRCFRLLAFSNGRGLPLGVRLSFAATLLPRAFDRWLYSRPAVRPLCAQPCIVIGAPSLRTRCRALLWTEPLHDGGAARADPVRPLVDAHSRYANATAVYIYYRLLGAVPA